MEADSYLKDRKLLSYMHSVSVRILSHWYCFRKWCPGAQTYFYI